LLTFVKQAVDALDDVVAFIFIVRKVCVCLVRDGLERLFILLQAIVESSGLLNQAQDSVNQRYLNLFSCLRHI
jgi:hypothetical protein